MRAVVKEKPGNDFMVFKDIPEPQVSEDLVKIRIAYSGVCGTDLHAMHGDFANTKPPVVLGHEYSGIVSEVGPNVTKIKVGDRVTAETNFRVCGKCPYCATGDYNLCVTRLGIGSHVNGSMAEYLTIPEARVHKLADNITLRAASLTEPLACAVHAVIEKGNVQKGETVVVFGAGAIGQLVSQICTGLGARVIMTGLTQDEERFEIAKNSGIYRTVDQLKEDLQQVVLDETNGLGADAAFECSGAVIAANTAMKVVHKKARVIQMGIFRNPENMIATDLLFNKEITYVGSRSQKPSSWVLALDLLEKGLVDTEKVITNMDTLENWRGLFDHIAAGKGCKAVIHVNEDLK